MFSVPGFLMGIVRISLFMNINDQGVLVGVGEKDTKMIVETLKQINKNAYVA